MAPKKRPAAAPGNRSKAAKGEAQLALTNGSEGPEKTEKAEDAVPEEEAQEDEEKKEHKQEEEEPKETPNQKTGKAKQKAKASAKSKEKGKTKGDKTKKTKGKPDKDKEKDKEKEEEGDKKKKKNKSLRELTSEWKKGTRNQEEEEATKEEQEKKDGEAAEGGTAEEKRDYNKARKFNKLVQKNALPHGIAEMLKEIEQSEAPRKNKTKLVNSLFDESEDGTLIANSSNPQFLTFKAMWKQRVEKDTMEGEPRTLFLHKNFHGNKEALQEAINLGEVSEMMKDGISYCCFPRFKISTEKASLDKSELRSDSAVTTESHAMLAAAFSKLSKHGSAGAVEGSQEVATGSNTLHQIALPAPPNWKSLEPLVVQAKTALDRLEKDMYKLKPRVDSCPDPALLTQLKELLVDCTNAKKDVDHLVTWKELPGADAPSWTSENVDNWLYKLATRVEEKEEGLEKLKAILKTRNL